MTAFADKATISSCMT